MRLVFQMNQVPDLTLYKYASLAESGVKGVLKSHLPLLRQMNRIGILSDVSFHLLYAYSSGARERQKLSIYLMVNYSESSETDSIRSIIFSSQLSDFFDFTETNPDVFMNIPKFNTCCILSKNEDIISGRNGNDYYTIREMEMDDSARLYNMCNIMESLNQDVVYRVDLYPVDFSGDIRTKLSIPIARLKDMQREHSDSQKDYIGTDISRDYEKIIKKYSESPHFITNIMAFSDSYKVSEIVLDAAASEALKKGNYRITQIKNIANGFDVSEKIIENDIMTLTSMEHTVSVNYLEKIKGLVISESKVKFRYLSVLFTLEEVEPFFRLPALFDGEVIQIPKETAPRAESKKDSINLGKDRDGYDVYFPLEYFPKHAFISGVPGSGKTNAMHHITSSLWKKGIPFLVFEPAKQEYRALFNDPEMKGLYLFSPNADMTFPLHINPFEMAKGVSVSEHIGRLCSVFEGAFPLEPPLPFLIDTSIEAVYRELGWEPEHVYIGNEKNPDGSPKDFPTMSLLYSQLEKVMEEKYKGDVHDNIESALQVRIGSLLKREMGAVFDVPRSSIEPEMWLKIPAIIELESMGRGPSNFLTLILLALIRETLKVNPSFDGENGVRHVIFIEEAHNLIGPESEEKTGVDADPKQAATAFLVKMLAEVRALHEGIVIADQLPTVMADEVLKNTGLKIGLKITSQDDRALLGGTMAASNIQLEEMATFDVGDALIFYEKLKRPFIMHINEWMSDVKPKDKEPLNDFELKEYLNENEEYRFAVDKSTRILLDKYKAQYSLFVKDLDVMKNATEISTHPPKLKMLKNLAARITTINPEQDDFKDVYKQFADLEAWYYSCSFKLITQKFEREIIEIRRLHNTVTMLRAKRLNEISSDCRMEINDFRHDIFSLIVKYYKYLLSINYEADICQEYINKIKEIENIIIEMEGRR